MQIPFAVLIEKRYSLKLFSLLLPSVSKGQFFHNIKKNQQINDDV